jgi:poly [ADP-ribose] polymerase
MRILSVTNRFYNCIPHAGDVLPILSTRERLLEKHEMLKALVEMEIASKLLDTTQGGDAAAAVMHPLDVHYGKLKCQLDPVAHGSDVFSRINAYMQNTHAATHSMYTLELVDLWDVHREGEAARFAPWQHDPNRKLLWHGSRLTNWVGIISQGLRIAPPEAPSTGYMFGKGVYFADMSSKSANYCFTTSEKTTAMLLLCEVALGHEQRYTSAHYVEKLDKGKASTKGCGQTHPDPSGDFHEDNGCVIPMGKGTPSGVGKSTLLYNEYIVYDTTQVKMRYLLRVEFHYKKKTGTFF